MLDALVPDGVVVVVAAPEMWHAPLTSAEARSLDTSSDRRRREFQAGRAAAREALARCGIEGHDLTRTNRAPRWPAGVVGAITHTGDYCAAAVAPATAYAGLGIDAERHTRTMTAGVRDRICTPDELTAASAVPHAEHIIFSTKESYFKAYYPHTGHWIGFDDATVSIDPAQGTVHIELVSPTAPRPPGLTSVAGRYVIDGDLVLTALAAPRPGGGG